MPGPEKLIPICRAENVSLSWLLDGRGAPFLVDHHDSDEQLAHHLCKLLEKCWDVYLVTSSERAVIVLTAWGSFEQAPQKKPIEYMDVEILAGPIGPKAVELLLSQAKRYTVNHVAADKEAMKRLVNGYMGTYELVGDRDTKEGLLSRAERVSLDQVAEAFAPYGEDLSEQERILLEKYRQLTPSNRSHAWAVVNALAHEAGLDTSEQC